MPDNDEPVTPEPAPEPPAEADQPTNTDEPTPTPEPVPPWLNYLYTGPDGRIYTNIPLTATNGAVITWHSLPATDGAWTATDEPANTFPDNHRPEPTDELEEG